MKVGFSTGTEVDASDNEVDEASAPSSMSSAALTEPRRAADVYKAEATTALKRMLRTKSQWIGCPELRQAWTFTIGCKQALKNEKTWDSWTWLKGVK